MIIVTAAALESHAQTTSATLRGRIADEQRAVLPGVTVTAHQLDTNTSRSLESSSFGQPLAALDKRRQQLGFRMDF